MPMKQIRQTYAKQAKIISGDGIPLFCSSFHRFRNFVTQNTAKKSNVLWDHHGTSLGATAASPSVLASESDIPRRADGQPASAR